MAGPIKALFASEGLPTWRAFSEELRRRGYEEGRNLAVEPQLTDEPAALDRLAQGLLAVVLGAPVGREGRRL